MRQFNSLTVFLLLIGFGSTHPLKAQFTQGLSKSVQPFRLTGSQPASAPEPGFGGPNQDWVKQKWTGNERPYLKIKADLDAEIARGVSPSVLAERYPHPMQSNTLNPTGWFACAYATQLILETQHHGGQPIPLYNLRRLPADCYTVARLRFLLTQELEANDNHLYLVPLAERLLKREPNDYRVRHALIRALCSRPAGTARALSLAQADVRRDPTNAEKHRTLAGVYEDMYGDSRGRNTIYRERTIQGYEAYLKYAKPDDYFRSKAVMLIQVMKTEKPW